MQPPRNHQMQHQPGIALQADGDAFAHPAQANHSLPFYRCDRRLRGSQQKRADQPHVFKRPADYSGFERAEVSRYVW